MRSRHRASPTEPPPGAPRGRGDSAAAPPESRWTRFGIPVGIFLLALLVRVAYLIDSADHPAFTIPISDAQTYDECARRWIGGGGMDIQFFWQPFFYPFWLGCVYALDGGSVLGVRILQAILGALTCVLTYALGRRLFDRRTGIVAALITALYGPLIFHESELLAAGLATLWTPILLLLFLQVRARPTAWRGLVLGAAAAISILTRPEFTIFLVAAGLWLAVSLWRTGARRRGLITCAAAAAAFAVTVLPVCIQNTRVTGHFSFMPYSGGINVYLGNHPDPNVIATAVSYRWDELQRQAQRAGFKKDYDRERWFHQQTKAYVTADPLGFVQRLLWKSLQVATSREIPRSVDVYAVRPWSALQRMLTWKVDGFGFPFGVLLPLALIGLAMSWRRIPAPIWLFLVLYPLALVLVFVTARYRVPMVPVLAVLAAAGGIAIVRAVQTRAGQPLALMAIGSAAIVVIASIPGPFALERPELNTETGLYTNIGHYYRANGDETRALEFYELELATNPRSMAAHSEAGNLLSKRGRHEAALAHFDAAVRAHPDVAATHFRYGLELRGMGRPADAAEQLRTATDLSPDDENYQFALAVVLAQRNDFDGAAAACRAALRTIPADTSVRCLLGRVLEDGGHLDEAIAEYRAILALDPGHREAAQRLRRALEHPSTRQTD